MQKTLMIVGILALAIGCSREKTAQPSRAETQPAAPAVEQPARVQEPTPAIVTTDAPAEESAAQEAVAPATREQGVAEEIVEEVTEEVSTGETTHVAVVAEEETVEPPVDDAGAAAEEHTAAEPALADAIGATPLFDFEEVASAPVAFTQATMPIECDVAGLPTGNCDRTLCVVYKTPEEIPNTALVLYGITEDQQLSALAFNHLGQLMFWGYGADMPCTNALAPGRWTVVTATHGKDSSTLYVNGEPVYTRSMTLQTPGGKMLIGARGFVGTIGDVKVYDTALTPEQVRILSETLRKKTGAEK